MSLYNKWILLIHAFVFLFFLSGCNSSDDVMQATIIDVVDGDTMNVRLENGKEDTVRLLLVDTPETDAPGKSVQPFGTEATTFAENLLAGKKMELEIGENERGKYDRLLAYLYVDGEMFNKRLLKKGLARVAYVYPPNTKYVEEFRDIEQKAKEKEIGIWSLDNYVHDDGFYLKETSGLKYDPKGADRDCRDFDTQTEAQAFYDATGPGDPHKLDGSDDDGKVCESLADH